MADSMDDWRKVMPYGQGSIYRRESDGRWIASIEAPRAPGGKRRRRVLSGTTREAVEAKLQAYRADNPAPTFRPPLVRALRMEAAKTLGHHTEREWLAKLRRLGTLCVYCGRKSGRFGPQKDHVMPISRGGSNGLDNVVPACRRCNSRKSNLLLDEWIELETMSYGGLWDDDEAQAVRDRVGLFTSS